MRTLITRLILCWRVTCKAPVQPRKREDTLTRVAPRASSTTSISASIMDYRKIHGRTFHNFNTRTEYWCALLP